MNRIPVPVEDLPDTLPTVALAPFLVASVALAAAYGSSFFLVEALKTAGGNAATAGAVISIGTVATILASLVAGKVAERVGTMPTIIGASVVMAGAMACFAASGAVPAAAYLGGSLLGIGWSTFYILAPLQVLRHVTTRARIKYLTFLSGSQMLGIGLAAPSARWLARAGGSAPLVYVAFAAACLVGVVLLGTAQRALSRQPHAELPLFSLTLRRSLETLRASTLFPIVMIGVGACIFAGLSTFQALYATSRGLSPDIFFVVFTGVAVGLRFSVAPLIGRVPLKTLASLLFGSMLVGLALLYIDRGSDALYVAATSFFALGYGLSYSTLNSMVVNIAADEGVSLPVSSQVFTLSYFIGLFGFPFIAGSIVRAAGFDVLLLVMMGLVLLNLAFLAVQATSVARAGKARASV